MTSKPLVIGLTGPFGSGKSTASDFFEGQGFKKITLSSFLSKELDERGEKISRKKLQDLGNELRLKNGSGILAQKALDYVKNNNISKAVVDGIRNLGEIEILREKTKFVLLGVVADRQIRFERIKKIKNREKLTREEFELLDRRDLGVEGESKTGLQVAKCLSLSDYFINSNDEAGYKKRLGDFLKKIS